MRIVFVTRKIDRGDGLTGFVFSWISALAGNLDYLHVICQERGDVSGLPENVKVHSFGKEKGYGKLRQGLALFFLTFKLSGNSDGIFVHMHPIYAIIAALPAKIRGRRVVFWYAHRQVDFKLKLAARLADRIVSSSPEGFRYETEKARFIGQAIDTVLFAPAGEPESGPVFRILALGRISPIKGLDRFIAALALYRQRHPEAKFSAIIAGPPGLAEHENLVRQLKRQVHDLGLENQVVFTGSVPHFETVRLYRDSDLLINLSETGSMDKAVLEAMAAGCLVLTSNEAYKALLPQWAQVRSDAPAIAEKIWELTREPAFRTQQYRRELRQIVVESHSLDKFAVKLLKEFA